MKLNRVRDYLFSRTASQNAPATFQSRERPKMPTEIVFSGGPTVEIAAEPLEVAISYGPGWR